jgi:hypothetical protein
MGTECLDKLFYFNMYVCECDIETYNLTVKLFEQLGVDEIYIPSIWWIAHKYLDDESPHLIDIIRDEWDMDASSILKKEVEILEMLNWTVVELDKNSEADSDSEIDVPP